MKPITIKQISERTGFSANTVSRALADRGEISRETAEQIRQAAREMGYVPNLLARGLAGRRSGTIGLVMGETQNPFHWPIVEGIQRELTQRGLNLVLANSEDTPDGLRRAVELLLSNQADGLLMFFPDGGEESLQLLKQRSVPCVIIGTETDRNLVSCIDVDNRLGGRLAATHLLKRGCRRIAYVGRGNDAFPSGKRHEGCDEAVREAGLPAPLLFHADATLEGGYRFATDSGFDRTAVDGIVAHNDLMAMGIMRGLQEQGVRIPEDIAIIGFDNIPFADYCRPALTTVHIQNDRLGTLALEMLLRHVDEKLAGREVEEELMTLTPDLIVRGSA